MKAIEGSFESVNYFAMPYPGSDIDELDSEMNFSETCERNKNFLYRRGLSGNIILEITTNLITLLVAKDEFLTHAKMFAKDVCERNRSTAFICGGQIVGTMECFQDAFEDSPKPESLRMVMFLRRLENTFENVDLK